MLKNGYMFLKYVLSQGLGELAAGNDSRNEPQSNALLRTTLRYLARRRSRSPPGLARTKTQSFGLHRRGPPRHLGGRKAQPSFGPPSRAVNPPPVSPLNSSACSMTRGAVELAAALREGHPAPLLRGLHPHPPPSPATAPRPAACQSLAPPRSGKPDRLQSLPGGL